MHVEYSITGYFLIKPVGAVTFDTFVINWTIVNLVCSLNHVKTSSIQHVNKACACIDSIIIVVKCILVWRKIKFQQ